MTYRVLATDPLDQQGVDVFAANPEIQLDLKPGMKPDELARVIGSEWKKARPVLTAHFQPLADEPARYRCEWLYDLYLRQMERHLSYQKRGKLGGRPKAELKAQLEAELSESSPPPKPSFALSRAESSAEAVSCGPTDHTANSPAPGVAPAPVGAALAGAPGNGDYLDRPSVREELLRRGVRPSEAPPAPDVAAKLAEDAALRERDAKHYAALKDAAWAWIRAHPDEAKALGREQRAQLGLPLEAPVTGFKADTLEQAMLTAIAERQQWPSADEWDGVSEFSLTLFGEAAHV
jgi:hypothetical protein